MVRELSRCHAPSAVQGSAAMMQHGSYGWYAFAHSFILVRTESTHPCQD
jgi:hypothetical protein